MSRETDYRGPRSPQKNTRKENCCSFQMLLYHRSLQKNPSEGGRERERERKGRFLYSRGRTSGRQENFYFFLCSSVWPDVGAGQLSLGEPRGEQPPKHSGNARGSERELADMCFFFLFLYRGVVGGVRWFRLPKLLGIRFTLSNLCCLKEKREKKKSYFLSLSSNLQRVILIFFTHSLLVILIIVAKQVTWN